MFLLISWRWVRKVVLTMITTRIAATILMLVAPPSLMKLEDSLPPKIGASAKLLASLLVRTPCPSPFLAAMSSSRKSEMKIGICTISGRHEANGLVLVSR